VHNTLYKILYYRASIPIYQSPVQHVLRVIPVSDEMAGYLHAWLASDYTFPLIQRFTYGAVVDEIDHHHLSEVAVPLPKDTFQLEKISDLVLQSNEKRSSAYKLEKDALKVLDERVLFANGDKKSLSKASCS
jgi:type I restriction enzyme, S subunit